MSWQSRRLKRVVPSTLAAEMFSLSDAVAEGEVAQDSLQKRGLLRLRPGGEAKEERRSRSTSWRC
eukprot:3682486-Prorocentrum_lima.AAC.1